MVQVQMRDLSKTKCYKCDKLEHCVRDCPQLRDRIKAIVVAALGSNSDEIDDMMMVSDKVSTSFH